jgi:hypothetical protein
MNYYSDIACPNNIVPAVGEKKLLTDEVTLHIIK